jgi:hypothetical protein
LADTPFMPFKGLIRGCCLLLLGAVLWAQDGGRRPFAILGSDQGMPPGAVDCMTQDRDGFLWFGSENGLVRYAGGQGRLWSVEEGLPTAFVARLVAAEDGLWIPTTRGLVRFKDGRSNTPSSMGNPSEALPPTSPRIAGAAYGWPPAKASS